LRLFEIDREVDLAPIVGGHLDRSDMPRFRQGVDHGEIPASGCVRGTHHAVDCFAKHARAVAAEQDFPITEYQPRYGVADSLAEAKDRMRRYCEGLPRPFYARYNPITDSIWVDRAVRRAR